MAGNNDAAKRLMSFADGAKGRCPLDSRPYAGSAKGARPAPLDSQDASHPHSPAGGIGAAASVYAALPPKAKEIDLFGNLKNASWRGDDGARHRQIFAGTLHVFYESLEKYGGIRPSRWRWFSNRSKDETG